MPARHDVLCGRHRCRSLAHTWERELLKGAARTWPQRCADECDICKAQRRKRCRVLPNANDEAADVKFSDAPLIHPWNGPKYHAALVRARLFARQNGRILLWVVGEDTPLHSDHKMLPEEDHDSPYKYIDIFIN